ncbi:MAG: response regulator [Bacteroidetes bacterium]|nr:MAG: response regulator [Bacteroidota bacterium]
MKTAFRTLLLVDDDQATVFLNRRLIEKTGFAQSIAVAGDGMEALQFLQNHRENLPDLIFLDLNMPRMNGWEFIDHFRRWPVQQSEEPIPLVLLTTYAESPLPSHLPSWVTLAQKPLSRQFLHSFLESRAHASLPEMEK